PVRTRYGLRMTQITLPVEYEHFRTSVRGFVDRVVRPRAAEADETGIFPTDVILKCGEEGYLGLPIPEKYGGAGADYMSYLVCLEELARCDPSVAITIEAHTSLVCNLLHHFGTEEQKMRWLYPLAQGRNIGA